MFVVFNVGDPEVGEQVAVSAEGVKRISTHFPELARDGHRMTRIDHEQSEELYVEEELRDVVSKVNAALVWGEAVQRREIVNRSSETAVDSIGQ